MFYIGKPDTTKIWPDPVKYYRWRSYLAG